CVVEAIGAAGGGVEVVGMSGIFEIGAVSDEGMFGGAAVEAVENNQGADFLGIETGVVGRPLASGGPAEEGDGGNVAALADGIDDRADVANGFVGANEWRMRGGRLIHG